MGIDESERKRRKKADAARIGSKVPPIAAIEKRVIDSEAFASLPPSAVVVLLLLARNLEKGKNGRVFVSQDDAERHGIERKTFYRQLKVLTAAGLIYPTRRGGNGQCSMYALAWLPLTKDTRGLFLGNFDPNAWRNHPPLERKDTGGKMSTGRGQKRAETPVTMDKNGQRHGDIFPPIELSTNTHAKRSDWMRGHLAMLASRNLAGRQSFEVPTVRKLQ